MMHVSNCFCEISNVGARRKTPCLLDFFLSHLFMLSVSGCVLLQKGVKEIIQEDGGVAVRTDKNEVYKVE